MLETPPGLSHGRAGGAGVSLSPRASRGAAVAGASSVPGSVRAGSEAAAKGDPGAVLGACSGNKWICCGAEPAGTRPAGASGCPRTLWVTGWPWHRVPGDTRRWLLVAKGVLLMEAISFCGWEGICPHVCAVFLFSPVLPTCAASPASTFQPGFGSPMGEMAKWAEELLSSSPRQPRAHPEPHSQLGGETGGGMRA